MKKKIPMGRLEKLVILVMVVTLAVSILPQLDIQQLFAEDPATVTLELKEGSTTRPLSVSTTDTKAVEAVLLKDGAEMERKILHTNTPAQFDILQNGTYVIRSIDVQGSVLEEHEQVVEGLADLYVEKTAQGGLTLYGRMENTDHISVTFKEKKEAVKVEKQENGLYQGSYTPKENGSYVFQSEAADDAPLGTTATYEVTDITEQPKEEPKKEEQPEVKELHITNEQGLKDIAKAPDKTYILDSDITVTADSIMVEKEFTGTLEGNGHVIKGLKQPLFTSLNKAAIRNVNLSSEINSTSNAAALAVNAKDTKIDGVGILVKIASQRSASGMLVSAANTSIGNSYVSGEITGEAGASGFVVSGNAEISNSYVTGIIEGKQSAYGFGKESSITNCYVAVYVEGKETGNFNEESSKLESSFYDISVASKEDPRAQEYTSAQLVSGGLAIDGFQQTKGSYPSSKKEITDKYSEEAKKLSALSTLAVSTQTSLMGLTKDVALPSSTGKEAVSWSAEGNVGVSGNAAIAKVTRSLDQDTEGTLVARTSSGTRVMRAASAKLLAGEEPQAGQSVAEKTTSISFNMKANHYYLITTDGDMKSKLPADHKTAIASGWRRYLWDGAISWDGLNWNTTYHVYDYDLKDTKKVTHKSITTKKGQIGGSIQLSEDMAAGATLTATLKETMTTKGSWKWEKAESPTSTTWTELSKETSAKENNISSSYVLKQDDSSKYIRATFTAADEAFEGSITASSKTVVKAPLSSISIYNNTERTEKATNADMIVDKRLYALVEPQNFDTEVEYTWHHIKSDGTVEETVQGRGTSYLLQEKDVNERICVRATAKGNGGASGTVVSENFTQAVKAAPTQAPTIAPVLSDTRDKSVEDKSITVKMPEAYTKGEGLYQFAFSPAGSGVKKEFPVYARGSNPVTITGLEADTQYFIFARVVGENGHLNSDYNDAPLSVYTQHPFVTGTLDIEANAKGYRYGGTLNAVLKGNDWRQTGEYTWYLVNDEGERGEAVSEASSTGKSITLNNPKYVGHRLEVVYTGTENYGGEISAQSEIIQLAEQNAPVGELIKNGDSTDNKVFVTLPSLPEDLKDEKFNIGYSKLENGVPEEYRPENQKVQYTQGQNVTIEHLDRNTTYYFFLRFDANEKHEKSDWSVNKLMVNTKQTEFDGAIYLEYGNEVKLNPVQGDRLKAKLGNKNAPDTIPNTIEGTWKWYKTEPGQERAEIKNFYPDIDGYSTYYEIPEDEVIGTVYEVEFIFHKDYTVKKDSGATSDKVVSKSTMLQELKKDKMTQPDGTLLEEIKDTGTDSTITFRMNGISGLVYRFCYSEGTDVSTAIMADYDAYAETNVTIKNLKRDTIYHIWVQVKGNDEYADSDWSVTNLAVKTKKTAILGYIEIEGADTAGEELTASYKNASYMPAGDDTKGTWQWYRETDSGGYGPISGGDKTTYTPTSSDINRKLKAVYTMKGDDSFTGSKESETTKIRKALVSNPEIIEFRQGSDTADSRPTLDLTVKDKENVWYRIQKRVDDAPEIPTQIEPADLEKAGWTLCSGLQISSIDKDHKKEDLKANTDYVLYIVRPETGETQVSSIINRMTSIGQVTQTGSIEINYLNEAAKIDYPVIGKTIKATLKDANNNRFGTWKWYRSNTDCGASGTAGMPSIGDDAKWTQLSGGYSPTINSDTSTLTVSEDMWKYYIKAEFVPNKEEGYGGDSIKAADAKYVRKIYNETVLITSSTKNGDEDLTAYPNTKITATVSNPCEEALAGRLTAYINETTPQQLSGSSISGETLTVTLGSLSAQDTKNIYVELTPPDNRMLYVDETFQALTDAKIKSDRIPYKFGVPISTPEDFRALITEQSGYKDGLYMNRSSDAYYVITDNINFSSLGKFKGSTNNFAGTIDGDYHVITGLPTYLSKTINGTSDAYANIRNMIIFNANINNVGDKDMSTAAVFAENSKYTNYENILIANATLAANWSTGYFVAGISNSTNNITFNNCGSVGGISTVGIEGAGGGAIGGFGGDMSADFKNIFSINTKSIPYPGTKAYSFGGIIGYTASAKFIENMENVYVASPVPTAEDTTSGAGMISAQKINAASVIKNVFYDTNYSLADDTKEYTITDLGTGLPTKEMIGTKLQSSFGNGWNYRNGYYPLPSWMSNLKAANLFAATRGAFTSVVSDQTSESDMFNGDIYGAVKVPVELQGNEYEYVSSNPNIIKVTDGGTIIPVGTVGSKAKITIRYNDPNGGFADNDLYEFTVRKKTSALASVTISGNTNPGQKLTATANDATTYQWYKRKTGSTERVAVSGATSSTYTLKPSDVGYEFNVDVGANGFATMSSEYTDAVTSVKPTGVIEKASTDNSVTVKAQGIEGADYEYAYATSSSGNKIIAGHSTDDFTITGLARNRAYWIYARVAGGFGYEPSEWSSVKQITTRKTDIVGPIKTNGEINMQNTVRASIGDDNLQEGTWKVERIAANGNPTDITSSVTKESQYIISYKLARADVGSTLKFSFIGTGDYKDPEGGAVAFTTPKILKMAQVAPTAPEGVMKDAHTITIRHTGSDIYDFGYTETAGKGIKELDNGGAGYAGDTKVEITDMKRNTTYYLYARLHEKDDHEPSDWSPYATATTDRSNISGQSTITVSGETTVNKTLTFMASGTSTDTRGLTGIWVLERVNEESGETNTVLGTVDAIAPNKVTYQLKPEDAGYKVRATYNANGDYKGNCVMNSVNIANAKQSLGTVTTEISAVAQYSLKLKVSATSETDAIYEFGYKKSSEDEMKIKSNNVTVTWGKDVDMSNLSRNTEYDFYIRKAAKIGYDHSNWEKVNTTVVRTEKSPLIGNISVGDNQKPSVESTITVSYDKGIYPDNADDTGSGSWQWYLGDEPVPESEGGTSASYKIPPVDGNPTVKVRYIAKEESDFTAYSERSFGKVYKEDYLTPKAPTVTSKGEDNTQIGSLLHLVNNEEKIDDMYYYLQSSDIDDLPALEISEDVDKAATSKVDNTTTANTGHWIKVTAKEMDIRVEANRSYVTYVARLESRSHAASGINSTRSVKSEKEPLARVDYDKIEEADSSVEWKTLQSKTLRYTVNGKAPTVSWKYYVASTRDATEWQNIDAEMKAVKDTREDGISADGKYAISRFEVPLKYTGQYLKVTMTGVDDYSGTITHITENPLKGALITGTARIETTDTTKVLDTLGASYLGEDEKNGTFTWYRQRVNDADMPIEEAAKIADSQTTGNTSTYSLTPLDLNCMVYAVYTAAENTEYVGSVQTNGIIVRQKAEQNQPNAPTKVRVNGNSIQFSTPTNYKTDKTVDIPYVQVGYLRYVEDRPVNDAGAILTTQEAIEANIHWQSEEEYKAQETWFYGLKKDSDYKLFARFIPTAAYDQSAVSEPSAVIKTEHALFREDALVIQDVVDMRQAAARPSNIGSQIQFSYSGEGYDEGEFLLHRSNGETIPVDSDRVETNLTAKTISYSYTYTKEDVGSYITVEYKAKADAAHYQGSIKKTNSVIVTKAVNPESPKEEYRGLERDLDTNLILTKVNDTYEYYLTSDKDYVPEKEDWDTVEIKENGSHEFTNLDRLKEYYLWTRIAETDTYDPSAAVKSEGLSPAPFIDFGPLTITNSKDRATPPKAESDFIAFPDTLQKGSITINENQITKKQEDSDPTAEAIDADIKHPVSDFQKADGSATDLVYEKGSAWGDRNFAVELVFYDKDKKVLTRADGRSTSVAVPETAGFMKVFIYRVNAMSETGYIWEAMLKDDSAEHITAKLKADITMTTQITMQLPTKIQLTLDDQVMKQSTNNEQAINKSSMPMEFGIDRKVAEKSTKVPALKGQMTKTTYYDQIPSGDAYLKCSNDGTNFTNITSGAWLDTGLPNSEPAHLMRLGADAWSGYYFSGITSKAQTWDFTENKFIDEAYKFKFIIEVAKEDASISGKRIYEVKGKEETK